MRTNSTADLYRSVKDDYEYKDDVMSRDTDRVRRAKYITSCKLSDSDKIVIRLYAELGSLSKLGEALGFAKSTMGSRVREIQRKVRKEMENCDI